MSEAGSAAETPADAARELRPVKGPFVAPRVVVGAVVSLVLGGALAAVLVAAGLPLLAPLGLLVLLGGVSLAWWAAGVAYRKERYEIHPGHVRCRRGGVLSDQSTELDVRNVTHVKLRLPWLRHKFFGIGDVIMESAGSAASEVVLRSIAEPETVYDDVRALMKRNGYDLEQRELLHDEIPDLVGVVVETVGLALGAVVGAVATFGEVGFRIFASGAVSPGETVGLAIAVVALLGAFWGIVIRFLDLRLRRYRVYEDVVVYEEGFLTRDNAFIPYENIADANTKRTILDQILGLYDVEVSCQGSGSNIKFRRLRQGKELTATIERIVAAARAKARPERERESARARPPAVGPELPAPPGAEPELVAPEEAWTAELSMYMPRVVVPLLVLMPAVPLWLIATIQAVIRASVTRFRVRESSVQSSYKFLTVDERDFAYEKITGLVVVENPWDWIFGTVTVRLWSIGSPRPLELAHVERDLIDLPALLRQVGIPEESADPYAVTTAFGPLAWARARLPLAALAALGVAAFVALGALVHAAFLVGVALIGLGLVASLLYGRAYFARQRLVFHDTHVRAESGLIVRRRHFARYANVKKVRVARYPASDLGSVTMFVAGEVIGELDQKQKDNNKLLKAFVQGAQNAFGAAYVTDLRAKLALIDDIMLGRVAPRSGAEPAEPLPVLREARPALGNTLLVLIGLSVLLVAPAALLPFSIPIAVLVVRRRRYRVDAGRVVFSWGVLYRSQASILFDRIDTLRHGQGVLNKMFRNGEVTLMTAGSSRPDLVLAALPEHEAFYAEIRAHYGKRTA